MGELTDKVIEAGQVGLDTSLFIYYFEKNPKYVNLCREVFEVFEIGKAGAITSMVTLLEVLVRPLAEKRQDLVSEYIDRLTTLPNLLLCQIDKEIAVKAAAIRAEHKIKTPDAIQIGAAIVNGARLFLANDAIFRRVKEIEVVILDDFVEKKSDDSANEATSGSNQPSPAS